MDQRLSYVIALEFSLAGVRAWITNGTPAD